MARLTPKQKEIYEFVKHHLLGRHDSVVNGHSEMNEQAEGEREVLADNDDQQPPDPN